MKSLILRVALMLGLLLVSSIIGTAETDELLPLKGDGSWYKTITHSRLELVLPKKEADYIRYGGCKDY